MPEFGFRIAYDENHNVVDARDAKQGVRYSCYYCGCKLFHKKSVLGNDFYAKYKGEIHTARECKTIERTGRTYSFSESKSPEELANFLCHIIKQRSSSIDSTASHEPIAAEKEDDGDELAKTQKFTSLKQIYEYGLHDKDRNQLIGNHKISDFYLHYFWFFDCLNQPDFKLTYQIVHVKFNKALFEHNQLLFNIYKKDKEGNYTRVYFCIECSNKSQFNKHIGRLREAYQKEDGTIGYKAHDALIVSNDWHKLSGQQAHNLVGKSYNEATDCLYYTVLNSDKQIYSIPLKE